MMSMRDSAHASCCMNEGCSHTYEDGPHDAHDGWAWDGMGKWRSAFTGNIWMGMGMDGDGDGMYFLYI